MKRAEGVTKFKRTVRAYYKKHGRHTLPWRNTIDPYNILVSEYMLQQTQVSRVIPKYSTFIARFPTIQSLAQARLKEVLVLWSGLGYNRRAKYLHSTAQVLVEQHKGKVPNEKAKLMTLPGVGSYTASAVCVFAYNIPEPLIETNIRTVLIQYFFPNKKKKVTDAQLLQLSETLLDKKKPREWYWALMDYGAHLKTQGIQNNSRSASYAKQSVFTNSDRWVRGRIIKTLTQTPPLSSKQLAKRIGTQEERVLEQLKSLRIEELVQQSGRAWHL